MTRKFEIGFGAPSNDVIALREPRRPSPIALTPDYYPQKKPKNYREAEGATRIKSRLSAEDLAAAESMPDADLDKHEAYNHPKIKSFSRALVKKVKSGELSREDLGRRMQEIMKLRGELSDGSFASKTDVEQDGWRFPARQLYKLWQAYNDAIQTAGRDSRS